jgi:protein-arginine kinase activator protein McsA
MKCYVCRGKGFVLYVEVINTIHYEFVAYCTCAKGGKYAYDGRKCEKNRTEFYVPCVSDVLEIRFLIEENQRLEKGYSGCR